MRLASAAMAVAQSQTITQEESAQLSYASMLIDVSCNKNSHLCQVLQWEDEDTAVIGLPTIHYFTEYEHTKAVAWLYPDGQLDPQQQYCALPITVLTPGMLLHKLSIQMRV